MDIDWKRQEQRARPPLSRSLFIQDCIDLGFKVTEVENVIGFCRGLAEFGDIDVMHGRATVDHLLLERTFGFENLVRRPNAGIEGLFAQDLLIV